MARKLLLCLLAAFAVILFAGCDNSNNGGVNQIVLHPNGGVGSIEPISFNVGEAVQIPYNEDEITREGYDFIIWNTKADGSGKDYARKDYSEGDERGTITLYAQWYKHYDSGDLGPQGGRVFYSRIEDGREDFSKYPEWIYLEIAPKELNYVGQWGAYGVVGGTKKGVGEGKTNTELIIEKHGQNCAAYHCKNPQGGGANNGWYLPSQTELIYLFNNIYKHEDYDAYDLKLDLPDTFFWSSTEGYVKPFPPYQDTRDKVAVFKFYNFPSSAQDNYHDKGSSYHARPVRQF